ncbi:MAG: hypothetical protein LN417_09005 [Candidatus Thermoplasmatota archaeon]|nr:hypothetical protein [Candidatus Thermoplasmatota archaeon]
MPIGTIIGVIIVVIIVIGAIFAVFFFMGLSSHATLKVRVNSEHIYYTVQYELYIDGSLKDSDSLAAGYYVEYTFDLYPGSDCHTYNVYASSTGGGLGAESDSENVYLCAGETKTANLYI